MKHGSAPVWWRKYGSQTFELQDVATRVLSVATLSGNGQCMILFILKDRAD